MNDVLTKTHLTALNKALSALADAKRLCDRCESAGIDVTEQRGVIDLWDERLARVKREFFATER